ncbi:hypothetical protein [Sigmofec virus UA08Rod_5712]|uniref:Uncharacterized protein n=1 Tax=Sigmofec virus UA08Rod_5712 TaxID=2929438 RepID=A0A976R7A9_9VIRU|nr:hypothetical protein [Sigmofec virus UA08Rod_5712]
MSNCYVVSVWKSGRIVRTIGAYRLKSSAMRSYHRVLSSQLQPGECVFVDTYDLPVFIDLLDHPEEVSFYGW